MSAQTFIPGTEPPSNPDIEKALDAWLEAKSEQKYAADKSKLRHATLILQMTSVGIDIYPYVDPANGKKRQVVIARDPKAKTKMAPRWNRHDKDAEIGDEVELDDPDAVDNKVEHRKVKRASVEKEIDPFTATRKAMAAFANAPAGTPLVLPAAKTKKAAAKKKTKGRKA